MAIEINYDYEIPAAPGEDDPGQLNLEVLGRRMSFANWTIESVGLMIEGNNLRVRRWSVDFGWIEEFHYLPGPTEEGEAWVFTFTVPLEAVDVQKRRNGEFVQVTGIPPYAIDQGGELWYRSHPFAGPLPKQVSSSPN